MKKILFADCDDTLFQSFRKCPPHQPLKPMAVLKDGSEHSFATEAQVLVLEMLQREMALIPVTARNLDAFRRVRLEPPEAAVIDYGGVVIGPDGTPDKHWLERTRDSAATTLRALNEALGLLLQWAGQEARNVRARIIEDFAVPLYVCAKSGEGDESAIDLLETRIREHCAGALPTLAVHRNGNNLSVLPRWLDKRHAVEYLIEKLRAEYGEIITFGMGDSLSDGPFMSICDYALAPRRSQIVERISEH